MTDRDKLADALIKAREQWQTTDNIDEVDCVLAALRDAGLVVVPQTPTSAMRAIFIRFALDSGNVDPMWSARYWQEMVEKGKVK